MIQGPSIIWALDPDLALLMVPRKLDATVSMPWIDPAPLTLHRLL